MKEIKKILKQLLIAFALISIGFALGKHSTRYDRSAADIPPVQDDYVAVYYMHSTLRCATCNKIQKMTRDLLDECYLPQLRDGRVKWQAVDFQVDTALARQFEIASSCVVVAQIKAGKVSDYKRLEELWTLIKKPDEFNRYIGDAIDSYLGERL